MQLSRKTKQRRNVKSTELSRNAFERALETVRIYGGNIVSFLVK